MRSLKTLCTGSESRRTRFGLNHAYPKICGASSPIGACLKRLDVFIESGNDIFITGDTGTGKEVFARAVHDVGNGSKGPFIPVNCGAIEDNLFLSDLFGHERGAFTGADSRRHGAFDLAQNGILFLDEIGDVGSRGQLALLRTLEEKVYVRLGGVRRIPWNGRLVFATNRDLGDMVRRDRFRKDLYFRIRRATIEIPPLRKRVADIPVLADFFLQQWNAKNGARKEFDRAVLENFQAYSWPGNVRELKTEVENVCLFSRGDRITENLISREIAAKCEAVTLEDIFTRPGMDFKQRTTDMMRLFLIEVMRNHGWDTKEVCSFLGLEYSNFFKKCRRYEVPWTAPQGEG